MIANPVDETYLDHCIVYARCTLTRSKGARAIGIAFDGDSSFIELNMYFFFLISA